jgi:AcrR family transcriptional regulator
MLHVGLDVIRHKSSSKQVATVLCHIHLDGLASREPTDAALDRSAAMAAADALIATWGDDEGGDDKAAHVRAVARAEFGRRGYEMTTIRDIASAAGLGTGTVYRVIGSKEELLMSIMMSFGHKVGGGWSDILRSKSTLIEKLDALTWLNINALHHFPDEFRIQLAWMRQTPPDIAEPGWSYGTRVRQMKALLGEGLRSGVIRIDTPTVDILARCVIGVQWIPENILNELGTRRSLIHERDTVLRGIAIRTK